MRAGLVKSVSLLIALAIPVNAFQSVLILDDMHQYEEAQRAIASTLQKRIHDEQLDLIAVEGAFGDIDVSKLRNEARLNTRRAVAEGMLKENKIGGPLFMALSSAGSIPAITGVDDRRRYKANVEAYRSTRAQSSIHLPLLASARIRHASLAPQFLNRELAQFHRKVDRYRSSILSIADYAAFLDSTALSEPAVARFLEALALEKKMDQEKWKKEGNEFLKRKKTGNPGLSEFPQLRARIRHQSLSENLNVEELLAGLDSMEKRIYESLIETPKEKAFLEKSRTLWLASKLVRFQMSPAEWKEYQHRSLRSLAAYESFYRIAESRNKAIALSLLQKMKRSNSSQAALVVGGFHSDQIATILEAAGVSTQRWKTHSIQNTQPINLSYLDRIKSNHLSPRAWTPSLYWEAAWRMSLREPHLIRTLLLPYLLPAGLLAMLSVVLLLVSGDAWGQIVGTSLSMAVFRKPKMPKKTEKPALVPVAAPQIASEMKVKYLILGAGPTGLGAGLALKMLGENDFVIVEGSDEPGGLARTFTAENGFQAEIGVHIVHPHYSYYDELTALALSKVGDKYVTHRRDARVWFKGRMVAYPFQYHIGALSEEDKAVALKYLKEVEGKSPITTDFESYLQSAFGEGIGYQFMIPYNTKIWGLPLTMMSTEWMRERVPPPDQLYKEIMATTDMPAWGPNAVFKFPSKGGSGLVWKSMAENLIGPAHFLYLHRLNHLDVTHKTAVVGDKTIQYQDLITTVPIPELIQRISSRVPAAVRKAAAGLFYTNTHVVALGIKGQPKPPLDRSLSWLYVPSHEFPFYRMTLLSNYFPAAVPDPDQFWSVVVEIAGSDLNRYKDLDWIEANKKAAFGLIKMGLINDVNEIVSYWYKRAHYGYPIPTLERDNFLNTILSYLSKHAIHSRGRFGGWKYEASNQDHSFAQGWEIVRKLILGEEEVTYFHPDKVNTYTPGQTSGGALVPRSFFHPFALFLIAVLTTSYSHASDSIGFFNRADQQSAVVVPKTPPTPLKSPLNSVSHHKRRSMSKA